MGYSGVQIVLRDARVHEGSPCVSEDDPDQVEQETEVIFIEITGTGEILVDRRRVDIRAVEANVQNLLAANPDKPVVVSAHRDAESGLLVRVIDQARMAGAENVSIATEEN
jgi:biopolymer transport protein ExbD